MKSFLQDQNYWKFSILGIGIFSYLSTLLVLTDANGVGIGDMYFLFKIQTIMPTIMIKFKNKETCKQMIDVFPLFIFIYYKLISNPAFFEQNDRKLSLILASNTVIDYSLLFSINKQIQTLINLFPQVINNMLSNNSQLIQKQLLDLFQSIKVDKSKQASVQKSTLVSLLVYHHVDTQYPQYFRYVSRTLEKFKKTTITQEQFLKIFMNPDIDMGMADKNELADAFAILDPRKTGSIDVREFLEAYRLSQNYQQLPEDKKRQAQDQIKQAFYSASQDGKITPMDFYHIVKFR